MSGTLINIIIQLIGGVIGGHAVGGVANNVSAGTTGNTIAGGLGGVAGGSLLTSMIPYLAARRGGFDIGALVGQPCRRRRIRRDSDRDRRRDHEQHEESLGHVSGEQIRIARTLLPLGAAADLAKVSKLPLREF